MSWPVFRGMAEQGIEPLLLWFLNKYIPVLHQFQLNDLNMHCTFDGQVNMILKKHFKVAYAVKLHHREGVLRCWKWLWLCALYIDPNVGESQLEAFGMQGPGAVLVPALGSVIGLYWCRGVAETPHPPEGGSRLAAESTKLLQDLTVPKGASAGRHIQEISSPWTAVPLL